MQRLFTPFTFVACKPIPKTAKQTAKKGGLTFGGESSALIALEVLVTNRARNTPAEPGDMFVYPGDLVFVSSYQVSIKEWAKKTLTAQVDDEKLGPFILVPVSEVVMVKRLPTPRRLPPKPTKTPSGGMPRHLS